MQLFPTYQIIEEINYIPFLHTNFSLGNCAPRTLITDDWGGAQPLAAVSRKAQTLFTTVHRFTQHEALASSVGSSTRRELDVSSRQPADAC